MNAHVAREVIKVRPGLEVGPSSTESVSVNFPITAGGSKAFRLDIYTGRVTGTVDVKLQHSSGFNIWSDVKTISVSASTNTSCTVNPTTDQVTATGHGLVDDEVIVLNATTIPGGADTLTPYIVKVVDANNFTLIKPNGAALDFTSAGSGVTFTKVRLFSTKVLAEDSADVSLLPLRSQGRVVAVTDAGENIQLVGVRILQED